MKNSQQGSVLLIVILIMTIAIFTCSNLFKSSTLTIELILKRQERIQKKEIAHVILNYGIFLCKKNFSSFQNSTKKEPLIFDLGSWVIEENKGYQASLEIFPMLNSFNLKAIVILNNIKVFESTCIINKKNDNKKTYFIISKWKDHV